MNEVPNPERQSRGRWFEIFEKLTKLPAGQALKVICASEKRGANIRTMLRAVAKKNGRFLSSSYSADRLTRYFWLEPEENLKAAKR